jgi:hypothetical protein
VADGNRQEDKEKDRNADEKHTEPSSRCALLIALGLRSTVTQLSATEQTRHWHFGVVVFIANQAVADMHIRRKEGVCVFHCNECLNRP